MQLKVSVVHLGRADQHMDILAIRKRSPEMNLGVVNLQMCKIEYTAFFYVVYCVVFFLLSYILKSKFRISIKTQEFISYLLAVHER